MSDEIANPGESSDRRVDEVPSVERRCDCLESNCYLCGLDRIDFEETVCEIIQQMGAQKVDF